MEISVPLLFPIAPRTCLQSYIMWIEKICFVHLPIGLKVLRRQGLCLISLYISSAKQCLSIKRIEVLMAKEPPFPNISLEVRVWELMWVALHWLVDIAGCKEVSECLQKFQVIGNITFTIKNQILLFVSLQKLSVCWRPVTLQMDS